MELRIALTVLPVGPRGGAVLDARTSLWFALQISAGFSEEVAASEVDRLWPWVVHVVKDGEIELRAWVVDAAGNLAASDHAAAVPPVDTFTKDLRARIATEYQNEQLRSSFDLRLLYPAEVATLADPEAYQRASLPARAQYLATLPGELSRRLLATLYIQIPRAALFAKDANGVWQPNGQTLWIAPRAINGSTVITLAGDPAATPDGRRSLTAVDGGTTIVATGPGFSLAHFLAAPSDVFNLQSYDVEVNLGDPRYIELESLLLKVLDPFAELHDVRNSDARSRTELVDATTGVRRPVAVEAFAALVDAWRVTAFATAIRAQFPDAIDMLVDLLLPKGATKPSLTIPERWGTALDAELAVGDILTLAALLGTRLGLQPPPPRTVLSRVAERAGFPEIARLLAQAFDEILKATPGVPEPLRAAWGFNTPDLSPIQLQERRVTLALAALTEIRERREVAPLLPGLAKTGVVLRDEVGTKLADRWKPRADGAFPKALVNLDLAAEREEIVFASTLPQEFAASYLDAVWPEATREGPELPARGLPLRLGAETRRLMHEENAEADSAYREVAGVLLLARRGAASDVAGRPWRIVTSGAALVGELGDRLFTPDQVVADEFMPELLPIPIRPVFHQKLARADVEYHGQPMLAHSALERAYNAEDYTEDATGFEAAYTFHPLGSFEVALPGPAKAGRAPALRYGDTYEFRAGVLDQAGGLPPAIANEQEPWRLDPAKVAAPTAQGDVMVYRRKVPPGEINVLPNGRWARIPDDVTLRAREFWGAAHRDADSLPAVLLTSAHRNATFTLLPPSIDEHTLVHWAIPKLDDPDGQVRLGELKTALASVFENRALEAVALHDPAVTTIGIRIRGALSDNTLVDMFNGRTEPAATKLPFKREPIEVNVTLAEFGARPEAALITNQNLVITLPEGTFAVLELFPLVPKDDYDARFFPFEGMTDDATPFPGFVAFNPSVVLLEAATDRLPSPKALFDNLNLVDTLALGNNGDILVRFDGKGVEHLAFVDRFVIERDRWVWRNLPVVPAGSLKEGSLTVDERRRRAASGPPDTVFVKDTRDTDPDVVEWERIAAIDRGFADRPDVEGTWPRVAPDALTAGGPAKNVLLATDNRDGTSAADYLRFSLLGKSRYAGVLPAPAAPEQNLRRIVTGFRGGTLKPPKVLGIVPLTRSLEADPLGTAPGATPFLVLLDETFFREYGVGERIDLRLTLENLDFGEGASSKVPYRTGPLPDHWLGTGKYFLDRTRTQVEDDADPVVLDLFGPFGYSLDVSPSEALANASAFIAYPHAAVGAHWAMFVRMRRRLDRPSAQQISDWSEVHALYTLPDARLLASPAGPSPRVDIAGPTATLKDMRLVLDPAVRPRRNDKEERARNTAAGSRYRYFMLVSRVLAGAGQGFDAEVPVGMWSLPLFKPETGYQPAGTFAVEFDEESKVLDAVAVGSIQTASLAGGDYRARVLEIIVNGQYEAASRLDAIRGWTEFWKALLDDDKDIDAAGMIRRVSDAFMAVIR